MRLKPRKIKKATVDFETRSHLPIKVGAWKYSRHFSTEVMCLSWCLDDGPVHLWHPAYAHLGIEEEGAEELQELFDAIASGCLVEAHNAFFEQCIWMNVCEPWLGWPAVPLRQWRCSAAKASMHALPRALEEACIVMGCIEQKDTAGSKIMKKLSKPKKGGGWVESVAEFEALWAYNKQDVRAEHDLSSQLDDLVPLEQEMWFMDQEVNFRGVLADRQLCEKALALVDEMKRQNNLRFEEITGLRSASQRKEFTKWIEAKGLVLPNTQGETMRRILEKHEKAQELDFPWESRDCLEDEVAEALRIVYENNRTSTRKYDTALKVMDDEDDRIRGSIMYWGAERTARWAGRLIQPHNFPRGVIKDMDAAVQFILESDLETIVEQMVLYSKKDSKGEFIGFKDMLEFLSHALRGLIMAEPGRELSVSDFAAIEARVLFWLADETVALALLASGECIYCDMATTIYGYPCNKKEHPDERQMGKQAILGLGFTMGDAKFVQTCEKYNIPITDELAQRVVKAYRGKYKKVGNFWEDQENAAIRAMLIHARIEVPEEYMANNEVDEDGWVVAGKIAWRRKGKFLFCRLPSGRCNAYPFPELCEGVTYYFKAETMQKNKEERVKRWITVTNLSGVQWTEAKIKREAEKKAKKNQLWLFKDQEYHGRMKYTLKYQGINPETKKWGWVHTYSGKITENIVQGTARDLMAEAMLRAHRGDEYDVTLSVHDELVTEGDAWLGDIESFSAMMAEPPEWAEGCPIAAEGWRGLRYRK